MEEEFFGGMYTWNNIGQEFTNAEIEGSCHTNANQKSEGPRVLLYDSHM